MVLNQSSPLETLGIQIFSPSFMHYYMGIDSLRPLMNFFHYHLTAASNLHSGCMPQVTLPPWRTNLRLGG
jgi:hypothetical protein